MSDDDDSLIDLIYRTVTEPELWEEVGAGLRAVAGAADSLIFLSTPTARARTLHDSLMGEAALGRYQDYFHQHDLWMQGAFAAGHFRPGNVLLDDQLVDREVFLRSEFFNDYMRRQGADRMCGIVLEADAEAPRSAVVSLYRQPGRPGFDSRTLDRLQPLAGHLSRALRLARALQASLPPWQQQLIDALPWGLLLLDHAGRVRIANRAALDVAAAADGLGVVHDGLSAGNCPILEAALAASTMRRSAPGVTARDVVVPRPSGRQPYVVSLVPLTGAGGAPAGVDLRLAVVVVDPERVPANGPARLRRLFGLSPAETRLAMGLLADRSLAEIAESSAISVLTARTQLQALLRKTGVDRQTRLLRRLQQLLDTPGGPPPD